MRSRKSSNAPRAQAQPAPQARTKRLSLAVCVIALIVVLSACGYHVSGTAPSLPADWHAIAIPAFKNDTTQYRIEQRFTSAVIRQFIERTKYRIIQNPEDADAILHGEVISIETSPILFNGTTGQVTSMVVTIHTKVSLIETKSQKVVYHNDGHRLPRRISNLHRRPKFPGRRPGRRTHVARFRRATGFQCDGEFLVPEATTGKTLRVARQGQAPVPALVLIGTDPYLRDLCRNKIIDAYVPANMRDWALSRVDLDGSDWGELFSARRNSADDGLLPGGRRARRRIHRNSRQSRRRHRRR